MSLWDYSNYVRFIKFNTAVNTECEEGVLAWGSDDGTAKLGMPGGNVCLNVGQEQLMRITNNTGSTITNGTPVFVSGATGSNILVDIADAATPDDNRKTIAVATEDILNNQKGYVTTFGFVRDVDTSTCNEGDEIFVNVGGGFTSSKPVSPYGVVRVGYCTFSNVDSGEIFVNTEAKSVKDILVDSGDLTIKQQALKTLVLEQPVYEDIITPITRTRVPVANYPKWTSFKSPLSMYTFGVNDYIEFNFEVPHDYKEGTPIEVHAHGATNGLDVDDRGVKFQVDYSIQKNDYIDNIGAPYESVVTLSQELTIPASTTDRSGFILDLGYIAGTGIKIGSQISMKFTRITATGTAPSANPFVSTIGCHYQIDTIGSRQEYVK